MGATEIQPTQVDTEHSNNEVKGTRVLRQRAWFDYGLYDMSSEEEDIKQDQNSKHSHRNDESGISRQQKVLPPKRSKKNSQHKKEQSPKSSLGSCDDGTLLYNGKKQIAEVSGLWNPKEACRPILDEAPVFYPTEEEFKDTLGYIKTLCQKAESYGICRIVPPSSWKPPCPLMEERVWKHAKFPTRIQQLDQLQNRRPMRKKCKNQNQRKRKRRSFFTLRRRRHHLQASEAFDTEEEKFGFQSGPDLSLEEFKKFAYEFKDRYFGLNKTKNNTTSSVNETKTAWEPSVEDLEGEYWRLVEKSSLEVEVYYGADLETGDFISGFPKKELVDGNNDSEQYAVSGWNLNNLPRLPGSMLCFEKCDISGVLVPWLYVGMCFSSFCWHVEDHHLYSLNYMHFGEPKLWYGVPGSDASKLENAMKKKLPELFEDQPDLLHELVTQLSPSVMKSEGVSVYRALQNAGEFVLTFPRAYHSGFNCGFNCAEAVNVAPVDWLVHGQNAVELYSIQQRKTSISHDKILLGAVQEAVKALWESFVLNKNDPENLRWKSVCGEDGMLTKALQVRVVMEQNRRGSLPSLSHSRRIDKNIVEGKERECFLCFYDLYLSGVGCDCCPGRFSCLTHANLLCSCESSKKFSLFLYEIDALNTLVRALKFDMNSIRKWALDELHLTSPEMLDQDSEETKDCMLVENPCSKEIIIDINEPCKIENKDFLIVKDELCKSCSEKHDDNNDQGFDLNDIWSGTNPVNTDAWCEDHVQRLKQLSPSSLPGPMVDGTNDCKNCRTNDENNFIQRDDTTPTVSCSDHDSTISLNASVTLNSSLAYSQNDFNKKPCSNNFHPHGTFNVDKSLGFNFHGHDDQHLNCRTTDLLDAWCRKTETKEFCREDDSTVSGTYNLGTVTSELLGPLSERSFSEKMEADKVFKTRHEIELKRKSNSYPVTVLHSTGNYLQKKIKLFGMEILEQEQNDHESLNSSTQNRINTCYEKCS